MKHTFKFYLILLSIIFFIGSKPTYSQGFKGIRPLESTCEDVMRILDVEKCTFPFSVYFLKDFSIGISFAKDEPVKGKTSCFKFPVGTVVSLTVSYNKPFPIKDFDYELKYSKQLNNDIGTIIYENSEKGIGAHINNGLITDTMFGPTPEQYRQSACDCKK